MADKRKAHVEALQLALDTEKKGYRFYKIAANSSKDPKGKEVFEHLAKDEVEHMAVIATVFESITNNEPWMTYEEAMEKYGETPPEKIIFPDVPEEPQEDFSDVKALEEALDFEKKAVVFYTAQAESSEEDQAKAFYHSLIEIEEGHVQIIQAELDSLMGAGIWLGFQEISLEH
ncbi:MAG: ferritin family protein [Pseudomonadota bacterium]|jgi:rubrerythrin